MKQSKETIYAVTSGCYSDYRIDAMFSTKHLAEQFIAKAKKIHEQNVFDV